VIARLVASYVAIFAVVLFALSLGAYVFVGSQYHSLLLPALATPEGQVAYSNAMRRVALTIAAFDTPLLVVVGIASWLLARISMAPLNSARERERQFVADAAHELRSPLATIAAVAQSSGDLNLIARTALDASSTIADLLTLARQPNPQLLRREPVDLALIAQVCVEEFRPRALASSIALDSDLHSVIVEGDERRLRELIRNLLENALRHASQTISITCGALDAAATLSVRDDGDGVKPSDREHIFERFFHGDGAVSGTGLGLAIARWVATAHEGTIGVSDANPGAEFSVTLRALAGR
jgi:signal transduction histidine kinase